MELPLGDSSTSKSKGRVSPEEAAISNKSSIIATLLSQSSRHLFGPTSAPTLPLKHQVVSIEGLISKLGYLKPEEVTLIKKAFHFADAAHLGQYRHSGEPYITHPVAVAELCATWRLDASSIMAALLHDVIEDTGCTQADLVGKFGSKVAELVEGLTKLDKLEFQSHAEAQAESFRKMFMAMARDVRVILVKLADRTHNMRTLDAVPMEKRRRVAAETIEIYAPIAHRLGLNIIYRDLQDLSFRFSMPMRFRVIEGAVKRARGNRKEMVEKILQTTRMSFAKVGIEVDLQGREKTLFSIYMKMRHKHVSFSQVLDVYGFRVVVDSFQNCYVALGTLHALFKPMPGKFKDYIAIPKLNGYQSLHTSLIGPYGTPVEFQIRTEDMQHVAESGVAAHWLYKNEGAALTDLQQRTHAWLQSLLDIQNQTGDSAEFLEHVKIDLFPDSVYVFTPKSTIIALPRGATALDFAYTIHTDIGDHAVSARINHETFPLKTELRNGDIVAIDVSDDARPTPNWLGFVRTGKARSAIRHHLRTINPDEAIELGQMLLEQALLALNLSPVLPPALVERLINETSAKSIDELYADIGVGKRMAALVGRHILGLVEVPAGDEALSAAPAKKKISPVSISGNEPASVLLASCCLPIPGDAMIGHLRRDQTLSVHTADCETAHRLRIKEPGRWIEVDWAGERHRRFDCRIRVLVQNEKGALARIAAEIGESDANIVHVNMEEGHDDMLNELRFTVQVEDRIHLARLMRNVRSIAGVARILRERS